MATTYGKIISDDSEKTTYGDWDNPDFAGEPVYVYSIPKAPPVALWQDFLDACDVPEVGGNGVFQALLAINYPAAMDAYQLILRQINTARKPQEIRTLSFLYSLLVPALSDELKAELQRCLNTFNIPIEI